MPLASHIYAGDARDIRFDPPFHPRNLEGAAAVYDPTRRTSDRIACMQLELDGTATTGAYLHTDSLSGHSAGDGLLLRFLVRPENNNALVSLFGGSTSSNLVLVLNPTSGLVIGLRKGGSTYDSWSTGFAMTAGELYLVELYISGSAHETTLKVWHDGTLAFEGADTPTTNSTAFSAGLTTLEVGRAVSSTTNRLAGSVAELGAWAVSAAPSRADSLRFGAGARGDTFDKANLIAYWPLAGNANDTSGNGNDLTEYNSPTWNTSSPTVAVLRSQVTPQAGRMLGNGAGYASVSADLSNSNVFSIGCDVYLPENPGGTRAVCGIGSTTQQDLHWIGINTAGQIFSEAWVSGSAGGGAITAQSWGRKVHVALVVNGATSRSLYVDGVLIGESTASFAPTNLDRTSFGNVFLGSAGGAGLVFGSGEWTSKPFCFDRALSADEVAALADGLDPRLLETSSLAGPTLFADFAYTNGTTVPDLSGSGNALTLSGSPAMTKRGGGTLEPYHAIGWDQGCSHEGNVANGRGYLVGGGALAVGRAVVQPGAVQFHAALNTTNSGTHYAVSACDASSDQMAIGGLTNYRFFARVEDPGGGSNASQGAAQSIDTWTAVALVSDADNDHDLRVNDEHVANTTEDIGALHTNNFVIGARFSDGTLPWIGSIGRIVVSATTHTASERARITKWIQRGYAIEWTPAALDSLGGWYSPTATVAPNTLGRGVANLLMACDLNGSSQNFTISSDPTGGGDFTISAWVRVDNLSSIRPIYYTDNGSATDWVWLYVATDGSVKLSTNGASGSPSITTSAGVVTAGELVHVRAEVTRDGSSRALSVTTSSGESTASSATAAGALGVFTRAFIGHDLATRMNGAIAGLATFSTASLSASDAADLAAGASPHGQSLDAKDSLVAAWNLQSGPEDQTGNGYDLTEVGSPTYTATEVALARCVAGVGPTPIFWGQDTNLTDGYYLSTAGASGGYCEYSGAIPVEIHAAGYFTAASSDYMAAVDDGAGSDRIALYRKSSREPSALVYGDTANVVVSGTDTLSDSTWGVVGVRSSASDDHEVYLDGASNGTDATDAGTFTPSRLILFALTPGTAALAGRAGDLAIVTAELTADERRLLQRFCASPRGAVLS